MLLRPFRVPALAAATAAGRLQKIRLCCASVPRQLSPVLDLPPYATI